MSKTEKNKTEDNLLENSEVDEPTDTSFITNIKIDISASPDNLPKEKKPPSLGSTGVSNMSKESSFINNTAINNTALGTSRSSSRTTTLALDPRPYKKRETVYTTIIVILSVALVAQSGLLWAMHLHNVTKQTTNQTNKNPNLDKIIISGVKLNLELLEKVADIFMRKHIGKSFLVQPRDERVALAEFAQGQVHIIQMTEPLSSDEKKQLEAITGKPVKEIYSQTFPLGIYIDENSSLNELSIDSLRKIYSGEVLRGKIVGCEDDFINTYKFEENKFIDKFFQEKVMKNNQAKIKFNSQQEMLSKASQTSIVSIGYGEVKKTLPMKMKLVKIKPNEEGESLQPIINGRLNPSYPLVYNIYWYTTDLGEETIKFFVEEIKRQESQK
ncbi:MAG: substrate-binding domain-containing protein [Acidobacteria bacterium]|nr:substrate-binding domain-containing protein [Acidobacteriota bacterium]